MNQREEFHSPLWEYTCEMHCSLSVESRTA